MMRRSELLMSLPFFFSFSLIRFSLRFPREIRGKKATRPSFFFFFFFKEWQFDGKAATKNSVAKCSKKEFR